MRALREAARGRSLAIALLLLGAAVLHSGAVFAAEPHAKSVLLIYPHEQEMASYLSLDRALRTTLQAGSPYDIEYYSEYLDLLRFSEEQRLVGLVEYLHVKYSGRRIDLIVVISSLTFEFLLNKGEELFPGVPILFTSVNVDLVRNLALRSNITGVAVRRNYGDSVDAILRLQPDTREIVVPVGGSAREKAWAAEARSAFEPYANRVAITYLAGLRMSELLARLKKLAPHSVVLFSPLFYSDADGRYYLPEEALRLICDAANVPVYGTNDDHLGQGIVGGALYDLSASGVAAARMAERILNGESPAKMPIQELNPNHYMFDARQLLRWRISEARLPAGSTVLYRTASLWDLYRGYLLACLAVLLFQAALIFTLVRQTRRLTSSESQLRDLSGRLITARDEERKHIARELHDDFGQRVAALRIELGMLARESRATQQGSVNSSFRSVLKKTDELATDLRDLSHALHSSRLQHLGLRAALHELCSGVQKNLGIPVTFKSNALARPVPPDIAFCLYRVAQEALHNAGQHSRAAHIDVILSLDASFLRLRIQDAGKGFDYNEGSGGLGLASMRERLHMIGGELVVQSRPGGGTVLTAQVDLPERPAAASA